jgi:hypothetical protein
MHLYLMNFSANRGFLIEARKLDKKALSAARSPSCRGFTNECLNARKAFGYVPAKVMFPESNHGKALRDKLLRIFLVPLAIPVELGLPIRAIDRGNVAACRAAMPEASVYEHDKLRGRKKEIRRACHFGMHDPTCNTLADHRKPQTLLCRLISLASHGTHDFGTCL